jgi:hypothetical protein
MNVREREREREREKEREEKRRRRHKLSTAQPSTVEATGNINRQAQCSTDTYYATEPQQHN